MNKNLIRKQNTNIVLQKSKVIRSITKNILSSNSSLSREVVEEWIQNIWEWADEYALANETIPRMKSDVLNLKSLNLEGLGLECLSSRLCFLEYITTLDIANNNIEALPKEIINFRNLKVLNLENNPFILTIAQKKWTEQLKEKGCEVYLNSDVIEYTDNTLVDESWMQRLWDWADEYEYYG